jgi:urease accessory protein
MVQTRIPVRVIAASSTSAAVSGSSLSGHLELEVSRRADGLSYVSSQRFRAPLHIGKGYQDAGVLVVNPVNPTAGMLDGDEVRIDVRVRPGARLCMAAPSATRIFRSRSGKVAGTRQRFEIGEAATFEWFPEPLIPHAGARHRQLTELHVASGASVLFAEWMTPGRVAMNEVFAFEAIDWGVDLWLEGDLTMRECYCLTPTSPGLAALRCVFPEAQQLTFLVTGDFARNLPANALDDLQSDHLWLGHGPMRNPDAAIIRAVASDSLTARATYQTIRSLLHEAAGFTPPTLGRL